MENILTGHTDIGDQESVQGVQGAKKMEGVWERKMKICISFFFFLMYYSCVTNCSSSDSTSVI